MMKFHITEDGPKSCSAQPGNCPITKNNGEPHYESKKEAQNVYEKKQNETMQFSSYSKLNDLQKNSDVVSLGLQKEEFVSAIIPKKHGSYFGVIVPEDTVRSHLHGLREVVGEDKFNILEENKLNRDGEYSFHATVVEPKEVRQLKKRGINIYEFLNNQPISFSLHGIGSVSDGDKEAWYGICESFEADKLRNDLGLEKKGFHITLGFIGGDVHNKSKGSETLKIL